MRTAKDFLEHSYQISHMPFSELGDVQLPLTARELSTLCELRYQADSTGPWSAWLANILQYCLPENKDEEVITLCKVGKDPGAKSEGCNEKAWTS